MLVNYMLMCDFLSSILKIMFDLDIAMK